MAGSKDHTDISLDNILKTTVENLRTDEQQQYEDYMHQAKEKFLSQYTVDCHQKVIKHGETDVASLLSSLQVPNISKHEDIQSIKYYVDQRQDQMKQQFLGLEELIRKLTRTLEKSVAPSFPSYETSNRIFMSDASATNGDSQPQPLYGMPMNSYSGQIQPLPSLLGRSTPLNTVGPSEPLPRPSSPYAYRPACSTGQSEAALGPSRCLFGRSATMDAVGLSKLLPGPSGPYTDRPAFPAGQSGAALGLPCGVPIMANTTDQFRFTTGQTGYAYAELAVAHNAPNYYTPQQQYVLPSTYLNHNAPYNHRPINTIDRSRQEGRQPRIRWSTTGCNGNN
jgi:hypothetical protein